MKRWLVVLVLVALTPSRGAAQEVPEEVVEEARAAFITGTEAFREGRWNECATSFERSFVLLFAPELLYNIGLCYQRAASSLPDAEAAPLLDRAVSAYRRYLREMPDAEDVEAVRVELDTILSRAGRIAPTEEVFVEVPEPVLEEDPPVEVAPPEEHVEVVEFTSETRPRGEYYGTVVAGSIAALSGVIAIGLGVHAQGTYDTLRATCGRTVEGCAEDAISEVTTLSTATNAMLGVSGVALLGTAIGFSVEFTATETVRVPARVFISVRGNF